MKEDYLWDKSGKDAEIEKMETSLQMFRYHETAPPILPAKTGIVEINSPNRFHLFSQMRFAFASAACLAIILLLAFGVWFQLSTVDQSNIVAAKITPTPKAIIPDEQYINLPVKETIQINKKPLLPKTTAKRPEIKFRKVMPLVTVRPTMLLAKKTNKVDPAEVLTKEELYAYNQLMTALAITSSNLKLVKDKALGVEN